MKRSVEKVIHSQRTLEGGGFPVRRPFPTQAVMQLDPFLLLDEMGPVEWKPGEALGAPDHPHRGFETVTYVLKGHMGHKDSAGNKGALGPGDVQWMTAGAGVVHSELPDETFRKTGGVMHGFQLWVNLPARDKMIAPRYQDTPSERIPIAQTEDGKVEVRVVAGEALGKRAVIDTRTPISYLHFTIQPGGKVTQAIPRDFNVFAYVFSGAIDGADEGQVLLYRGDGDEVQLSVDAAATKPAEVLLIGGRPLDEPVARYGPFVMNTQEEIVQAFADYRSGKMGHIS